MENFKHIKFEESISLLCLGFFHSLFCLFLLLNNVENFGLTRDKVLSRFRKQPSVLSALTPTTRQLHTCYASCYFTSYFNDPLVLPDYCLGIETNVTCEMTVALDYSSQEILLYGSTTSESLTIDDTTYDSATSHLVSMIFDDNSTLHIFTYICATGDYCEWEYMQQIIPKLILLDYQPLYNALLPKVFNSNGHPNFTQCYDDTNLVSCSFGPCEYYQTVDNDYKLQIIRHCSFLRINIVQVEIVRHFPELATHDYDIVVFTCDKDQCNGQSNEYEIKQIISANGNEYINITINSSGMRFSWLNFNLYFLCVGVIKYLQ